MTNLSNRNFGILIAYILPGFTAIWGVSFVSTTVQSWLTVSTSGLELPTVGGFLYVTLASVALGMTVSAIRWFVIDSINEYTGLKRPAWDDSLLQANLDAFDLIVEHHYRYYQFYANSIVSILLVYAVHRLSDEMPGSFGLLELGLIALLIVFWAMSRDTLKKYYRRSSNLFTEKDSSMGNGSHHNTDSKTQGKKPTSPASSKDQTAGDSKGSTASKTK